MARRSSFPQSYHQPMSPRYIDADRSQQRCEEAFTLSAPTSKQSCSNSTGRPTTSTYGPGALPQRLLFPDSSNPSRAPPPAGSGRNSPDASTSSYGASTSHRPPILPPQAQTLRRTSSTRHPKPEASQLRPTLRPRGNPKLATGEHTPVAELVHREVIAIRWRTATRPN